MRYMIFPTRFPLLAKVLGWLSLHLLLLGLTFFLFVHWQLGLGLDSLVSGSAGERMSAFGDSVVAQIVGLRPEGWDEVIKPLADEKKVTAMVVDPRNPASFPRGLSPNVVARIQAVPPPPRANPEPAPRPEPARPDDWPSRPDGFVPLDDIAPRDDLPPRDDARPPRPPAPLNPAPPRNVALARVAAGGNGSVFLPKSRPVFLMRGENGDGYWAGVMLHLPPMGEHPIDQPLLLIHAKRFDGSGMFFDIKPWLWGGIAVLLLSLVFWTPFVWGISRYLHRLTAAADHIAGGHFKVSLPPRGNDELGDLGRSIESMAARLDVLIAGQKRFLGDAAHELCAPLARIRTGLGILEMKLTDADLTSLSSIEADTAELAALVEEILAFSRAGARAPTLRETQLEPLVREVLAREAASTANVEVIIPEGLSWVTDPSLLGRALGNLVRNALIHAGPHPTISIRAVETPDHLALTVSDDGPGVPPDELPRLFEPFYRLDRSRSRDTGGSGLGLPIVRTAIHACGGETTASSPEGGGFAVTISLPRR